MYFLIKISSNAVFASERSEGNRIREPLCGQKVVGGQQDNKNVLKERVAQMYKIWK